MSILQPVSGAAGAEIMRVVSRCPSYVATLQDRRQSGNAREFLLPICRDSCTVGVGSRWVR